MTLTERFKRFTILHSNDMHGDFLAEATGLAEGHVIGGMSLLSGYINKVRQEEKNVLFVISGDMLQGSTIDTEYQGISTIEIMNYLAPDVVTLGNHELDYGLPHLLFLEKMANFPIVNANLYIKKYNRRLMNPYLILNVEGFDIMFIGIVTEEALKTLKRDRSIGTFVNLEDAASEVGKICNAYKNDDIDLTILLTHIGFEEDKKLAAMLDPEWGAPDPEIEKLIASFKEEVDRKYNRLIGRLAHQLTHPKREQETELGNLIADIFAQLDSLDVVFVASGSIRGQQLGPLVTLSDLKTVFPYKDTLYKFRVSGVQLTQIFAHIMRPENRIEGQSEYFQVNQGIKAVYNDVEKKLESLSIQGQAVQDEQHYTICMDGYRYQNSAQNLGITHEELTKLGDSKVIATNYQDVLEEYLSHHQNLNSHIEGRLVYK